MTLAKNVQPGQLCAPPATFVDVKSIDRDLRVEWHKSASDIPSEAWATCFPEPLEGLWLYSTLDKSGLEDQFDFAYVNYKDTAQRFYNKSLFTLNIANPVKGYGISTKLYNKTKWDVQHLIHWSIYNSYHIVPYKEHLSFSGVYYLSQTTIGVK